MLPMLNRPDNRLMLLRLQWFYIDDEGLVQGGYAGNVMLDWYKSAVSDCVGG